MSTVLPPDSKEKIHERGEDEKDRAWFQKLDVVVPTMIRGAGESDVDGEEGRCFWQLLAEEMRISDERVINISAVAEC